MKTRHLPSINDANIRGQLLAIRPSAEISYHELADMLLPRNLGVYLDYGCGSLQLIRTLEGRYTSAVGVDVVEVDSPFPARFSFTKIDTTGRLPFPDSTFDTISIIEVIEHVPSEALVLSELARVLKPGGTFVLTTPHKGWLTWADPGNWKFDMPTFHRWAHIYMLGNREYYEAHFGSKRPSWLMGDVSGERHKHYSIDEILELLPSRLPAKHIIVSYPGMRLLWAWAIAGRILRGRYFNAIFELRFIRRWLSRRVTRGGDQLALVAHKL